MVDNDTPKDTVEAPQISGTSPSEGGQTPDVKSLSAEQIQSILQSNPDVAKQIKINVDGVEMTLYDAAVAEKRRREQDSYISKLRKQIDELQKNLSSGGGTESKNVDDVGNETEIDPDLVRTDPFTALEMSAKTINKLQKEIERLKSLASKSASVEQKLAQLEQQLQQERARQAFESELAEARKVVPDFSPDKTPGLWGQVAFAVATYQDKPDPILGKPLKGVPMVDVVKAYRNATFEAIKREMEAAKVAEQKKREVLQQPSGMPVDVSIPPDVEERINKEAGGDAKKRLELKSAYILRQYGAGGG